MSTRSDVLAPGSDLEVRSLSARLNHPEIPPATIRRTAIYCGLGGSIFLFLILFVLSPNAIVAPDPLTWQSIAGLVGVCLAGGLVTAAWVWGEGTLARRRQRTSAIGFIAAYSLGGLVVGLMLELLLPVTGFTNVVPLGVRLITAATVPPWAAVIVGLTYDGRVRVRAMRNQLVKRAAQLALGQASQDALLDELRATLHQDMESRLTPKFEETSSLLATAASLDDLERSRSPSPAEILRELNESSVRPFSRALDQQSRKSRRPIAVLAFISGVARFQSFRPAAVSGIFLLTVVADRWTSEGLEAALLSAISGVGLIYLILGSANLLMRRVPGHHASIYVSAFLLLQVPTFAVEVAVGAQVTPGYLLHVVFSILLSGCVVWLTSGIGRWRSPQAELLRIYADELDAARISLLARAEVVAALTQQAARYLHGAIQSKLTACILALELAAARQDDIGYAEAIDRARRVLNESRLPPVAKGSSDTLAHIVHAKADLWQGISAITVFVAAPVSEVTGPLAQVIGDIVEEGICNAIRHADAANISIAIHPAPAAGAITVLVVDDGTGYAGATPGMGMALLDQACPGGWSLEDNADGGCTLTATVMTAAAAER